MTSWLPSLDKRTGPAYKAIADALEHAIRSGTLAAGYRLPTHRDLAWKLGVTVATVTKAYQEARRRDLVSGEVGRGTFVIGQQEQRNESEERSPALRRFRFQSEFHSQADTVGPIDLSLNIPSNIGQSTALADTLAALAKSADLSDLLQYQPDLGMSAHRAAGAGWFKGTGLTRPQETVIVTCGGQHGTVLSILALTRPGDVILTEPVTYPGIKSLAGQFDLRLVPVATDEDGLRPDALEQAIRDTQPRLLYSMPTLHNPLATLMSDERRRALAAIAIRHHLPVVEDDVYGLYPANRPPPLAEYLPDDGVYITSCSKTMAPGLRIGFLSAPVTMLPRFSSALRATSWMAPPPMAEVVRRWIEDGTADAILRACREDIATRRRIVAAELAPEKTGGLSHSSHETSNHLWLPLPAHWNAEAFCDRLARMGVLVLPSETFAVGRVRPDPGIRVCLGGKLTLDQLQAGLRILARALVEGPDHLMPVV